MVESTILVGRECNSNRIMISFQFNGQRKDVYLNTNNPAISSVSRCVPEHGKAHCSLVYDNNDSIIIKNLKESNVTFVDGLKITKKSITDKNKIELGCNRFPLDIREVFKVIENHKPTYYSIKHLADVWDEYHGKIVGTKLKQKRLNGVRSISGLFTIGGGLLYRFDIPTLIPIIIMGLGLVSVVLSFVIGVKDKSIEENETLMDVFQDQYVCPKCHHYLGAQPYKIIRQNSSCPYCKALWNEN